jgi:hypothetical protein
MRLALILFTTLALGVLINRSISADDAQKPAAAAPLTSAPYSPKVKAKDPRKTLRIPLHHVGAAIAAGMLKQLGYEGNVVPDTRTNAIIGNDVPENLTGLEILLKAIDRPAEPGASVTESYSAANPFNAPSNSAASPAPFLIQKEHAPPGEAAPKDVRIFRDAFNQSNAQAAQAAAELRQLQSQPGNSGLNGQPNQQVADLQRRLRDLVTTSYEARIRSEIAEINWHRERLNRIERQLQNRDRLKAQIIDRRIEELLNPGIQWDSSAGATSERGSANQMAPESDVSAREKRAQTLNNLKQLALAMHNFHDVYGHFPKAVTTARDFGRQTDTPHSWRIDLLPFLGAADLYQKYKMDEAWDGPNNKKLLDRMPAVFRSPYDDPKSMSTAYAVLVGTGTVFEPGREGIKISEITDGTSNTILVVEARRNCPWMKPEDIPFDADKPVPELGDFVENKFAAVMADGRACIFERSKVEEILHWMIRRNDGHPIQIPFE